MSLHDCNEQGSSDLVQDEVVAEFGQSIHHLDSPSGSPIQSTLLSGREREFVLHAMECKQKCLIARCGNVPKRQCTESGYMRDILRDYDGCNATGLKPCVTM